MESLGELGSDFKSQLSALESQISNLKSQVSSLKSQISNLKSQISNLKSQVSNLESQISEVSTNQKVHSSFAQADAIAAVERAWLPRLKPNHVIDYRAVY